jgi:hypothetical protein
MLYEYLDIFIIVYLDDILIFSENKEEYKEYIIKVLSKLLKAKLLVDPRKSYFHIQKVSFIRYIIKPNKISIDPEKIKAVIK